MRPLALGLASSLLGSIRIAPAAMDERRDAGRSVVRKRRMAARPRLIDLAGVMTTTLICCSYCSRQKNRPNGRRGRALVETPR